MTIEERDTARAIQKIAKHIEGQRINWEQRQYEIARDAMAAMIGNTQFTYTEDVVSDAVSYANALVKELQNNTIK